MNLDLGNEESPLKVGGWVFAHPESQQHVFEACSSYSCFLSPHFSFFSLFRKKKINNEKLEGGREERCLLCPLKGGHLLVVTQASLSESRPEPPAVPGSLGKGTAAGDPGRWGGFQTGQKQHFSSPPHGPFPCACGLSGGWYILFSEKYLN